MMLHKPLWLEHPHVRTGTDLTTGERAADFLKRWFGSWLFLGILNALFIGWVTLDLLSGNKIDPGLFYANLFLSWLAGQQGGALQIASNRGDRINSELALSTHANGEETRKNGEQLLAMNKQQLEILNELRAVRAALADASPSVEITQTPLTAEQLAAQVQAAAEQPKPGGAA